jgi:hypothetical protein
MTKFEKWKGENRHHLFPKSHWGTFHPDNIQLMQVIPHRAHHIIYSNQEPLQQLRSNLWFNTSTLIQECSEDIRNVLEFWRKEGREAYKQWIIR